MLCLQHYYNIYLTLNIWLIVLLNLLAEKNIDPPPSDLRSNKANFQVYGKAPSNSP